VSVEPMLLVDGRHPSEDEIKIASEGQDEHDEAPE
jgi:hypothetical protein